LNNPDKLTPEEFENIKLHVKEVERIIDIIISRVGKVSFLQHAKLFAGYHHEFWNGKGYPYGISGTDIPLQGRIMAIADVFDAIVSERPYKKAYAFEDAVQIIMDESGRHFDPVIANVFFEVKGKFKEVMEKL
jgi:putative two-component system response regulator